MSAFSFLGKIFRLVGCQNQFGMAGFYFNLFHKIVGRFGNQNFMLKHIFCRVKNFLWHICFGVTVKLINLSVIAFIIPVFTKMETRFLATVAHCYAYTFNCFVLYMDCADLK